jgi:hypothetical protein
MDGDKTKHGAGARSIKASRQCKDVLMME